MAYKIHKYNNQLTKDQNVLLERLYKFRVSNMAEALEQQFLNPNSGLTDYIHGLQQSLTMNRNRGMPGNSTLY